MMAQMPPCLVWRRMSLAGTSLLSTSASSATPPAGTRTSTPCAWTRQSEGRLAADQSSEQAMCSRGCDNKQQQQQQPGIMDSSCVLLSVITHCSCCQVERETLWELITPLASQLYSVPGWQCMQSLHRGICFLKKVLFICAYIVPVGVVLTRRQQRALLVRLSEVTPATHIWLRNEARKWTTQG